MGVNKQAGQKEGYGHFTTEEGNKEFGSFEVFYVDQDLRDEWNKGFEVTEGYQDPYTCGWYWWACFPGCLPDGEPCGPFNTSTLAWQDAGGFEKTEDTCLPTGVAGLLSILSSRG